MSAFLRSGLLCAGAKRLLRTHHSGRNKFSCLFEVNFFPPIQSNLTCARHVTLPDFSRSSARFLRTSAFLFEDKNPEDIAPTEGHQRVIFQDSSIEKSKASTLEGGDTGLSQDISESSDISLVEPDSLIIEAFTDVYEKSTPKCPGCGAVFQSDNPEKLGYVLPSKSPVAQNQVSDIVAARTLVCQKCFNLKHYNKPFPITILRSEIMEYLGHLQRRKGLILYVVDMLDLPGSFYPNLLETVGEAKRIIVVGNKVDMLPVDGHTGKQEAHLQQMLLTLCKSHGLHSANVKSICLISAKSGFGILQLASKILEHWDHKGDIYLVGCSNAGKTSLFNLLLDLVSVHKKADLLQRATVSLWPCTTQRMLRFPIGHFMLQRLCKRLRKGVEEDPDDAEVEIGMDDEIIDKELTDYKEETRTRKGRRVSQVTSQSGKACTELAVLKPSFVSDVPNKHETWLYDTPGVISEKQITNLLTMEELKLLNPSLWLVPRTFILKPGQSLLLGGLGRVDYLEIKRHKRDSSDDEWDTIPEAVKSIFFTVFTSPNVPVHICKVTSADEVYAKHAGTELLQIPCGGKERMETFPALKPCDFTVQGIGWDTSAADVVLSNLGWVAVTAGIGSLVTVQAHTPNGVGMDFREPALCPTSVTKRGKRGADYQGRSYPGRYEATRKKNPQFIRFVRGQHKGEVKWMNEIKRKRKEQRFLLKAEKWEKVRETNLLERSAVSDPPQIPGAVGLPAPRGPLKTKA